MAKHQRESDTTKAIRENIAKMEERRRCLAELDAGRATWDVDREIEVLENRIHGAREYLGE